MESKAFIIFLVIFLAKFTCNYACTMTNVTNWLLPITLNIYDTDRGVFFQRSTSDITGIDSVRYGEGLNAGPYIDVSLSESFEFTIATNDQYPSYEQRETAISMGVTVVFRCNGSPSSGTLVFSINIIDTNNNAPEFKPNGTYHFKIAPPVPPGFLITDCINDIIALDIDLTTEMIVFDIEENAYFEIAYDGSTTPKEFNAKLRTKTFIRRLPEPITLWISATDVDRTNDPPQITNGTIRIEADTEFEFPDDLIFSETFYLATYSNDDQVSLQEMIFLDQGYDENVIFSLEGGDFAFYYEDYFDLVENGNSVDLKVTNQLPPEIWSQSQLYLIVRASRENTSGATATLIVNLQARTLAFESLTYSGYLVNNTIELDAIALSLGYDEDVNFTLIEEYVRYFAINQYINSLTLHLTEADLPTEILEDNAFLTLEIRASHPNTIGGHATIVLEIIKEKQTTAEFEQLYYYEEYSVERGLNFTQVIQLDKIPNQNITFKLEGDNANWFTLLPEANGASLATVAPLSLDLIASNRYLIFAVSAEAYDNVTIARSTIITAFMDETIDVSFDELYYTGIWRSEEMSHDKISVTGYDGTTVEIFGQYADSFTAQINEGNVIVELRNTAILPIDTSNVILELRVPGASCVLILEVIEPDNADDTNVFFDELFYTGTWQSDAISHERIFLSGYNGTTIEIVGQHADSFTVQINDGNVIVELRDTSVIPVDTSHVILELRVPSASCVLVLDIIDSDNANVFFEELYYTGTWRSDGMSHERIFVSGYDETAIEIYGQYRDSFTAQINEGNVIVEVRDTSVLPIDTTHVVLELRVPGASCVLILDVIDPDSADDTNVFFDELFYTGTWRNEEISHERIFVSGYNGTSIEIIGQYGDSFTAQINEGNVIVELRDTSVLPVDTSHIVLELRVPGASCVLILDVIDLDNANVYFEELYYTGIWRTDDMSHERIFVSGYNGTTIEIHGQYGDSFTAQINEGNVIVELRNTSTLPIDTSHVVLELRVPGASCVLILDVVDPDIPENINVFFDEIYYTGIWRSEDMSHERIFVSGYNGTTIEINGQYADSFTAQINEGNVIIELRDTSVLPIDTTHVVLELRVPGASSILILDVIDPENPNVFFEELYYTGVWRSEEMSHERIFVSGYDGTTIEISGQYGDSFTAQVNDGIVIVELRNTSVLPIDTTHVVLELRVPGARCVLILEVIDPDISDNTNIYFDELYYTGIWRNEEISHERIFVSGYNGTTIAIGGQYGDSFTAQINEGIVIVELRDTSVLPIDTYHVVLELRVPGAGSVLILNVIDPEITGVSFDELYYTGIWRSEDISHERIYVSGYDGTTIEITGQYSDSFTALINQGNVNVELRDTAVLPVDTSHIVLELRVPDAGSVLILDVIDPENPDIPSVRFSSEYYVMYADKSQTGLIGQVTATASNGESIVYSLLIQQDELKDVLSVTDDGQVFLNAPVTTGIHTFQVLATTELTVAENSAKVFLVVDGADFCSNERALSPLIILDRDEESPYENLVVLNKTIHENCHYSLINHWPVHQNWLYVDENGLHTRSIDREHESIAFMALSQIQVELILHCETQMSNTTRIKRSVNPYEIDMTNLGPYDYGTSKWVLTDSISYNSRRSFVNLIVNDINDNDPIFRMKEDEPIAVGYPLPELVDAVSPQALVELEATDADIGENAALLYWTSSPILAVYPETGSVYVRNSAQVENGANFTIYATDRNGTGRTGSIDIVIRLLNINSIAVVTIRDAYLEHEQLILTDMSIDLGYEVKALRSDIIPDNSNSNETENVRRNERETNEGAVLQLYIYGLIDREPVDVTRLTNDINDKVDIVNVATTVSLRDHLVSREIRVTERDTALLAATIALSILLFVLIAAFVAWQYLKWRKKKNYDKFSDVNSLASREHVPPPPPPPPPKTDDNKPRLNIEELKRSERRLQDILDAPTNSTNVNEPKLQNDIPPNETIINLSPEQRMPLVIQSIDRLKDAAEATDDEDEFGESKSPRRKSVVTFNENVEKIIHMDDSSQSEGEAEVYRL